MTPDETLCMHVFKNRTTVITNNSINDKIFCWLLSLNVFLSFCSPIIKTEHYPTCETQVCRVHFHQATNYEQIKSKNRKNT